MVARDEDWIKHPSTQSYCARPPSMPLEYSLGAKSLIFNSVWVNLFTPRLFDLDGIFAYSLVLRYCNETAAILLDVLDVAPVSDGVLHYGIRVEFYAS